MNDFLDSYLRCALWSSSGENEEPLDADYVVADLSHSARCKAAMDCRRFLMVAHQHKLLKKKHYSFAGHDFWLTRNGHGTGFWDKPEIYGKKSSDMLTIMSECFGTVDIIECENHVLEFFP